MEFTGKVIWMGEKRQGTSSAGKAWAAQEYAVQDAMQQYPRTVCFNVRGEEKIKEFNIRLGEELKVYFDINAREYNGRYFNDVRAWKVERPNAAQAMQPAPQQSAFVDPFAQMQQATAQQQAPQQPQAQPPQAPQNDDLPF